MPPDFTPRELEIIRLVALGWTNAAIRCELWIARDTLGTHLNNIYRKMGETNRVKLAHWGIRRGLVEASEVIG